jgi:4-hydroxy-3-methylbut-2-en-1-yl diphosphate synthase IspG/GcpE
MQPGTPTATRDQQSRALVRPIGPSVQARRRRAAGVVVTLAAVALLALPIHVLGAVTLAGQETPGAVPAGLAPGSVVVVQPGDTVRSLAMRINPSAAAQIARAIVAEVGSPTLVPGEHVVVP